MSAERRAEIRFTHDPPQPPQQHGPLLCWCREFGRTCPPALPEAPQDQT